MGDIWFTAPKRFKGTLSAGSDRLEVGFMVGIDLSGEAVITLDRFSLDSKSTFIRQCVDGEGTRFAQFQLVGTCEDGTTFECDNIIFTSLAQRFGDGERTMCPVAHYSLARLSMQANAVQAPALKWHIKGFRSFGALNASCPLGDIEMVGAKDADGKNEVSGFIHMAAHAQPEEVEAWRTSAEKLFEHLRHVMSFASDVNLENPIVEFINEAHLTVDLYSRGNQAKSSFPPFYWLDLQGIFACAVKSYFQPAFAVQNLYFAMQWFTMHGDYREANLISAMTVLENLIDSNLPEADSLILQPRTFEKLRKKLSGVIKDEVKEWTDDPVKQQDFVREFNNRLNELKRRSLADKLTLLAKRWGVKLDDIPEANIREAKSARDQVVHCGYYRTKEGATGDLHDHVLTVRELVVRFILTALQFEGSYESYVGGQNRRVFEKNPPALEYASGGAP